ncbi:MAG: hypothetical protein CMM53_09125 [Rhodospirillaceae bacterium]|nr:hypothetical protein [Rhodospirillaceae bacterium]|tara:strand:+ start:107 stop:505 length:399 start_codon:yes stop_codon:yes gene_type:complete
MKKIIPALVLLLFTSPVHAGELDGKYIYCPADAKGYEFSGGYVNVMKIYYSKEHKENRVGRAMGVVKYRTDMRFVRWEVKRRGQIIGLYRLDRQTVRLQRHGKTIRCHLSTRDKISNELKAVIAIAKRKNKL